jgi:hypothetical protein
MAPNTKVNSKMGSMMVWEPIGLRMAVCTQEIGVRDNIMVLALAPGRMDGSIQVNGIWDKHMGEEKRQTQMELFVMMGCGRMTHQ